MLASHPRPSVVHSVHGAMTSQRAAELSRNQSGGSGPTSPASSRSESGSTFLLSCPTRDNSKTWTETLTHPQAAGQARRQNRSISDSSTSPTQPMQETPRSGGVFAVMSPRSSTKSHGKLLQCRHDELSTVMEMAWLHLVDVLL